MRINRPPKKIGSFLDRKWRESITKASQIYDALYAESFILIEASPILPFSRALTDSNDIEVNDAGAGAGVSLDLSETGVTAGTYNSFTVDSKGRVTAASLVVSVPDEAYGVSWDGSFEVPTKNAVYDKIETIIAGVAASASDYRSHFLLGGM